MRKTRSNDILTYLFFVVLAAFIWFAYAMNTSRTVHYTVPISYVGMANNVVLSDSLPHEVTIEVMDKGALLRTYVRHPLSLHVNIAEQTTQQEGRIVISTEDLRRATGALLQGTTSLLGIQPDMIEGRYYTLQEKTVPVLFSGTYRAAQQYHITGGPTITPKEVTLYGSRLSLDTIHAVYTVSQEVLVDADSLRVSIPLITLPEVRMSETEGVIAFRAEEFTEKKMMVPVTVLGTPDDKNVHLFPAEVEVTLSVAIKQFAAIGVADVQATCLYPQVNEAQLPVSIQYTHPGIFNARVYPVMIDYLVEEKK